MILSLIRLTRPYYSIPLSGGLIVISLYLSGGNIHAIGITLCCAFFALYSILSAGYILNDVCDMRVDVINRPCRMLPAGRVSRITALLSSIGLFMAGIGISLFCGWRFFAVMALIAAGLVVYDLYSKRMGLFKNVFVAILTASLYPLSFTLTEPSMTPRVKVLFIHPIWLLLTTVGYEMLKDIQDTKGDSTVGHWQSGLYRNCPAFLRSARLLIVSASMLTLLPYLLGYCRLVYLIAAILAIALAGLSCRQSIPNAIRLVYTEVFIITVGSLADLLVYGP